MKILVVRKIRWNSNFLNVILLEMEAGESTTIADTSDTGIQTHQNMSFYTHFALFRIGTEWTRTNDSPWFYWTVPTTDASVGTSLRFKTYTWTNLCSKWPIGYIKENFIQNNLIIFWVFRLSNFKYCYNKSSIGCWTNIKTSRTYLRNSWFISPYGPT